MDKPPGKLIVMLLMGLIATTIWSVIVLIWGLESVGAILIMLLWICFVCFIIYLVLSMFFYLVGALIRFFASGRQ